MKAHVKELHEDTVSLRVMRGLTEKLADQDDDYQIKFSTIIGSFFPMAYKRMMDWGQDQYTQGYLAAMKEYKGENNDNTEGNS